MSSQISISDPLHIEIRPLSLLEEFRACTKLQQDVWGYEDIDVFPQRFFVIIEHIGGQVFGAFDRHGGMAGFLCAFVGRKPDGMSYLHSQMLAVRQEYRNRGVARRLKLAQRNDALQRGYSLVEWTFDPLELKNAYFNIEKLGAIVRRYIPNIYGATSSQLQAGLPTDRLVAEWWINTAHVKQALREIPDNHGAPEDLEARRVEVPATVPEWKSRDLAQAAELQARLRREFAELAAEGLCVNHFVRGPRMSAYIFTKGINCSGKIH